VKELLKGNMRLRRLVDDVSRSFERGQKWATKVVEIVEEAGRRRSQLGSWSAVANEVVFVLWQERQKSKKTRARACRTLCEAAKQQ